MKLARIAAALGVLGLSSVLVAQTGPSPEVLLKAAMNREVVDRDLAGAMAQYKDIVSKFAANHAVAAQALLRLGGLYERLGNPEARSIYQRIVREYADSAASAPARARLLAIQDAAAGPFKMKSLDEWIDGGFNANVSPDGKSLVYTREAKGDSSGASSWGDLSQQVMYLRDFATGRERVLFEGAPGQMLSVLTWSPDSQYAAFNTSSTAGVECHVITIATRAVRSVWKGGRLSSGFQWSPDSHWLAMAVRRDENTLDVRVVAAGGSAADLGSVDMLPATATPWAGVGTPWAPDSRRLAYFVPQAGAADAIRIRTIPSKEVTSLSMSKADPGDPTLITTVTNWTQQGEIEVRQGVSGGTDFFLVNPTSGAKRNICEGRRVSGGDTCAELSPDGLWQVTRKNDAGGGRITLRRTADGSERSLTPEAVSEMFAGGFSRDSRLFAFRSNRDGSWGEYVVPVDQIPVARPVKVAALESDGSRVTGTWTSNGALVLNVTNNETNLYRIDLDARTHKPISAPIRLTEDAPQNREPHVSPDGRRIAYEVRGRSSGFAMMDANGARERIVKNVPLIDALNGMRLIGWVSDGELLVSDAGPSRVRQLQSPQQLMLLNATTGELRPTGPPIETRFPPRVLAGGTLAYSPDSDKDGGLHMRPIGGGAEWVVNVDEWFDALSADGHWLAYTTVDESAGPNKPWPGDIRIRSLDSGVEKTLAQFADTKQGNHAVLDLSADGKFLIYQDPTLAKKIMNVETRESWPLVTNPPAGVSFEWTWPVWSPDGTFVVIEGRIEKETWRAYGGVTYEAVTKLMKGKQ